MELKTKYQYTNFIYPYIVDETRYDKYILRLLKDKNCKLKLFEKEKDLDIYNFFLPYIRNYLFPTFEFRNEKLKEFNNLSVENKVRILAKHSMVCFEYYLDENGQKRQSSPLFNVNNQTIYIALSSSNYPREQFVFQFSHECVHQYFNSPWEKESDTSWLEEFVAATTSYAVCDELGGRFSEYLQLCLHYNFDSVQAALPRFLEKIGNEYREHPSHVYCDEIKMPCLYYREHGQENWRYLFEAYDIVKQSLADTLGLRLLFNTCSKNNHL